MIERREYPIQIIVNRRPIASVVIDSHYEEKHGGSISDEIILALVATLDGRRFEPETEDDGFEYFVEDQILLGGKLYKLVWLLEHDQIYIGVVNAYRRD